MGRERLFCLAEDKEMGVGIAVRGDMRAPSERSCDLECICLT